MHDHFESFAHKESEEVRGKKTSHVRFADPSTDQTKIKSLPLQEQQSVPTTSFSPTQVYDRSTITLEDILNSSIPSSSSNMFDTIGGNDAINPYDEANIPPISMYAISKPSSQMDDINPIGMLRSASNDSRYHDEANDENMMSSYELDDDLLEPSGPYEVKTLVFLCNILH